jgi:hypothetical protein
VVELNYYNLSSDVFLQKNPLGLGGYEVNNLFTGTLTIRRLTTLQFRAASNIF